MKNVVIAFMILFVGGLLLANAPPGADQFVTHDDVSIEMTIEQPAGIMALAPEVSVYTIYQGGVVLQVRGATWSATILKANNELKDNYGNHGQAAIRNARDGLIYGLGYSTVMSPDYPIRLKANSNKGICKAEGPERLELYSIPATWRYQETYS